MQYAYKDTVPFGFVGEERTSAIVLPRDSECKHGTQDWVQRGWGGGEGMKEPTGVARETPSGLCSSSKASVNFYFMPFPHRKMIFTVNIMNEY